MLPASPVLNKSFVQVNKGWITLQANLFGGYDMMRSWW